MTVQEIIAWVRDKEERIKGEAVEFAEQHLPVLADWADKVAQNPVFAALAEAEHLPQAPEVMASLADDIRKIDAALGAAKQAGAAEVQAKHEAAAAEAAANQAAEPSAA